MLKLTIEGITAEELLVNLIAAANAMSAGADLSLSAGNKPAEDKKKADVKEDEAVVEHQQPESTVPTGRRGARKGAEKADKADDADASAGKGRRSRGAAKADDLVNDNEEQAALRAQLITDLQDLADVEEAHGEVQEALQRTGAKSVKEVASASLGDFNEAIQALINKYFE